MTKMDVLYPLSLLFNRYGQANITLACISTTVNLTFFTTFFFNLR